MIKITKEGLALGLDLSIVMETCPNSQNCLWLGRLSLQMPGVLPKSCLRKNCEVTSFRRTLEDNSPAFYAEALRFSRFNDVAKATTALATVKSKSKRNQKRRQKRLARRNHDLRAFGQLVVLAIYPLFLGTKTIPFLATAEIKELRSHYCEAEIRQTIKTMNEINSEWLDWIRTITENLLSTHEQYPLAITYLVYLFLEGTKRSQLPDLANMPPEEKDRFFSELLIICNQKK